MNIDTNTIFSMTEANQNFSMVARIVDQYGTAIIFKNNKPRYEIRVFDDAETDETLKKIYGLGYISKAMLIFAALGSSVGAMNRIALMFMNQQDECEQDRRLALYKTNPSRVKGVNYTDNYLTAWKIFYAGTCIFRSTQ